MYFFFANLPVLPVLRGFVPVLYTALLGFTGFTGRAMFWSEETNQTIPLLDVASKATKRSQTITLRGDAGHDCRFSVEQHEWRTVRAYSETNCRREHAAISFILTFLVDTP